MCGMWEGMETLGTVSSLERNRLEWWGQVCVCVGGQGRRSSGVQRGLGVGPGRKVATSQVTDAQLRR